MLASTAGFTQGDGALRVVLETDAIAALCLEGDFDLTNAQALREEIDRVLESGNGVILDLSGATFIDSSVIHVLERASRAADGREQAMVLQLGTAGIVERALELAGIEHVLPRAHDRQEAVRMVQERAETV
jgi:anti-anti-sigma factor